MVDLNATQAAQRCKYSPKTAYSIGQRLLKQVEIQAAVTARRRELATAHAITQERILGEMARLAFSDLGEFVSVAGGRVRVKDFASADGTRLDTRCVSEISETVTESGGTIKIKLHNKQAALRDLGEHLGLFEPQMRKGLTLEAVMIHHQDGTTALRVRATQAASSSTDPFGVVSE